MIRPVLELQGELNKTALLERQPVVFRNQNLGPCLDKWRSSEYLQQGLQSVPMSVHVVKSDASEQLNFIDKNFQYQTLQGQELMKRIFENEHSDYFLDNREKYYLRSLGSNVRKDAADCRNQFDFVKADINWQLFDQAIGSDAEKRYHSSILRIASPGLRIWTHYDNIDNFLFQIVGERFVTLYSPRFADEAYLQGDKSKVVDPYNYDHERYPEFPKIELLTCSLRPGDVLFIPALWFHHISMGGEEPSIGVNMFWKGPLPLEQYYGNDLYGNRDPVPAEQALGFASKITKLLKQMPDSDHRRFYARRICTQIMAELDAA